MHVNDSKHSQAKKKKNENKIIIILFSSSDQILFFMLEKKNEINNNKRWTLDGARYECNRSYRKIIITIIMVELVRESVCLCVSHGEQLPITFRFVAEALKWKQTKKTGNICRHSGDTKFIILWIIIAVRVMHSVFSLVIYDLVVGVAAPAHT